MAGEKFEAALRHINKKNRVPREWRIAQVCNRRYRSARGRCTITFIGPLKMKTHCCARRAQGLWIAMVLAIASIIAFKDNGDRGSSLSSFKQCSRCIAPHRGRLHQKKTAMQKNANANPSQTATQFLPNSHVLQRAKPDTRVQGRGGGNWRGILWPDCSPGASSPGPQCDGL